MGCNVSKDNVIKEEENKDNVIKEEESKEEILLKKNNLEKRITEHMMRVNRGCIKIDDVLKKKEDKYIFKNAGINGLYNVDIANYKVKKDDIYIHKVIIKVALEMIRRNIHKINTLMYKKIITIDIKTDVNYDMIEEYYIDLIRYYIYAIMKKSGWRICIYSYIDNSNKESLYFTINNVKDSYDHYLTSIKRDLLEEMMKEDIRKQAVIKIENWLHGMGEKPPREWERKGDGWLYRYWEKQIMNEE